MKITEGKDERLNEAAVKALGLLALGEPNQPYFEEIFVALLAVSKSKSVELQFIVGEALCILGSGYLCPASKDEYSAILRLNQDESASSNDDKLKIILEAILGQWVKHPLSTTRQAAAIWLLSALKLCGQLPSVQAQLRNIQSALLLLVGENEDTTQDIASKGLSLLYELGSDETKAVLVDGLVATLSEGKMGNAQKFTPDSDDKVFEPGTLGTTKDGAGLSTYKELCSIASDMNKPDLIYKFMQLAKHNSMWNSRRGAAFGFSRIAKQAHEQLKPHLSTLIPRLFRFKYDPSASIQSAMTNIWDNIVSEPQKAVDFYFAQIIDDLKRNITSRQWRTREACCLALDDVLRGRGFSEVGADLRDLWRLCFLVMDDIKESVRKVAFALFQRLA